MLIKLRFLDTFPLFSKLYLLNSCLSKRMKKTLYILFLFLIGLSSASAQKKSLMTNEIIPNLETAFLEQDASDILIWVNKLYIQDTILPDDGAFFLACALHMHNKPVESKKAFLRYIDLTKENGKYYKSTVKFVHDIDKKLGISEEDCDICKVLGPLKELDTCSVCLGHGKEEGQCTRCQGIGSEVCPTCSGTGFERIPSGLQVNYLPCRTCHRLGTIKCQNCNGTKTQIQFCENCSGDGMAPKLRTCKHKTEPKTYFYK